MSMSRWNLHPRAGRFELVSPACVLLAALTLVLNVPLAAPRSEIGSSQVEPLAGPAQSTNGTPELVNVGQTSLGPPGNTPAGIAYDDRTGEMFVAEAPSYLTVL